MFGREPAVIIAVLVAIVQGLWIFIANDAAVDTSMVSVLIAPLIGGLLTRRKVIPVETVKDAGLSPAAVKERADDPQILKHHGK